MSEQRKFPVLRVLLGCVFAGVLAVGMLYEFHARAVLTRGRQLESKEKYPPAGLAYRLVVERYPFSYASVEARAGLLRIEPALEDGVDNQRLGATVLEQWLGERFNPYSMDYLPLVSWAACSGVLAVVFLTRLRRPGIAVVGALLAIAAAGGALVQCFWYELASDVDSEGLAQLIARPGVSYGGSYALMGLTALLTLTSSGPRPTEDAARGAEPRPRVKASSARGIPTAKVSQGPSSSTGAEERLRTLRNMLQEGLISQGDYEAKKAEILRQM